MKKRCTQCQAVLMENVTQCPLCYREIGENEPLYSLEDVPTLFVKRKNDKIFGPFPKAKVLSLVSTGKLEASEAISDDRETWVSVAGVQEFAALLKAGPVPVDSGVLQDLPTHKEPVVGRGDLPGLKSAVGPSDLPGLKSAVGPSDLPGLKPAVGPSDLPGLKPAGYVPVVDLPAPRAAGPVASQPPPLTGLPGFKTDLPGVRTDLPGARTDLPGVRTDLPGVRTDLPGARTDLPDLKIDLPTPVSLLPGNLEEKSKLLSNEEEERDKNRDFSLPPLGGGVVPEMKLDLGQAKARPLELGDADSGKTGDEKMKIPPSLFESSDGVDLSALGGGGAQGTGTKSGLDLDHGSSAPPPSGLSLSLGDEEMLPLGGAPDRLAGAGSIREKKSASAGRSRLILLVPLVLLLLVAAAFALQLGPFSRKKSESDGVRDQPSGPRPTAAAVTEHERNLLQLDHAALLASSRGEDMIHCESALILAWFYHDLEPLEACKKFLKTPIATTGDALTRRFHFFRALLLNQGPPQTTLERFYDGPPVPDPMKTMEDILSVARSENNRAPVWNFLSGVVHLEKKDPKKAKEAFQLVTTSETTTPFGVTWFLSQLGDEAAVKTLQDKPEWAFWKGLLPGMKYMADHQTRFSLLTFPGEFPRVAMAEPAVLEQVGRRFRALNLAFAALSAWEQGQLDTASSLCDKAMTEDEREAVVWNLCGRLRLFHGQLGKFATTISLNQEMPTIVAWLVEGRRNPAQTAWEELKKRDPEGSLAVAPLILVLSQAEAEEVDAAVQAGLTADLSRTLEVLWTGIWQRPDRAAVVEKAVLAWKDAKKDEDPQVAQFLSLLGLAQALSAQDWKKVIEVVPGIQLKGSGRLELEALGMLARLMDSQDKQAIAWADSQWQRVSPGARAAAAMLLILGTAGKLQEAHQILDKYQEIFREPLFFKAAAQLFLTGTRKDRLMRARFFADKAIKANPQDAEALFLVGFIQLESGQHESGEKTIMQAVQAMSHPVHAWFMRWAELESRLKRPHMALAAMDAGLRQTPDHGPFLFRKAQILATQDNPKEALRLLEKTKEAGIEEVQRFILEGRCHVSLRQKREAELAFQKAVKADPKNILARYLLGKTQLGNGALRPAIPNLSFVVEQLEKHAQEQRLPEEATHWQTDSLESMLAEACRLLGGAHKETGNRAMAITYVKKYAALVPDGPMKDEALRLLLLLGGE